MKKSSDTTELRRWRNDETCKLIDLVEERPCIWNVFDNDYHNREKREKAYKDIESELNVPMAEIKRKIMQLRSQLGRELAKCNKTKSGQSTDELYWPTWIYWERLQFLRPVMQPGKSRNNLSASDSAIENQCPDEASNTDVDSSFETSDEQSQAKSQKSHLTPRQSKKAFELEKQELLTTCINVLKEPVKEQTESKPAVGHFAMYINEKLSQFDRKTRSIVQRRISDVIFDAEQRYVPLPAVNPVARIPQENIQVNNQVVTNHQSMTQPNFITSNSNGPYMALLQQ